MAQKPARYPKSGTKRLGAMGIKRAICCALRTGGTKTSAYNKAKNTLSWSNVPLTSIIASNCSAK
jgi:hypothetical protein